MLVSTGVSNTQELLVPASHRVCNAVQPSLQTEEGVGLRAQVRFKADDLNRKIETLFILIINNFTVHVCKLVGKSYIKWRKNIHLQIIVDSSIKWCDCVFSNGVFPCRDSMQTFEELSDIFSDHNNYLTSRELLMRVSQLVSHLKELLTHQ